MKYKMISEYGNAIYEVTGERQREEFERKGFKVMETEKPQKKNGTSSKTSTNKAVKKGE